MLNLADLTRIMTILAGPCSGFLAAHGHKADGLGMILLSGGGLALGFLLGEASSRAGYAVLKSKRLGAGVGLLIYVFIPFVALLVLIFVPFFVAEIVYGHL